LRWGSWGDRFREVSYTHGKVEKSLKYLEEEIADNTVEFIWSSSTDSDHTGSYQLSSLSSARWFERVHRDVSYLRFYFPIELLNTSEQRSLIDDLLSIARCLGPLHGYMGLGFQQCYEFHRYENLEYENAIKFNGLDVGNPIGKDELRQGIKSINWLTFVDDSLLDPLGGRAGLMKQAERINHYLKQRATRKQEPLQQLSLHDYDSGVMVQAGDLPQLGWVERDPYPLAYVAANLLLRPVRVKEIGSLHLGSIVGEVRFNKTTSNEWLRRFDAASDAMWKEMEET
jgi:hypothetical protein